MKTWIKRSTKIFAVFVLFIALFAGGIELYKYIDGNFHTVTEGELYRSARMDGDNFDHYIKQKGIKTIINLQGERKDDPWYHEEKKVAKEHGVVHHDFKMSAYAFYDVNVSKQLISMMKNADKPILIHCHGGADRSALVSALWLLGIKKLPKEEAQKQFKLIYGYFPYLMWDKKKNMRRSFEAYYNYLEKLPQEGEG